MTWAIAYEYNDKICCSCHCGTFQPGDAAGTHRSLPGDLRRVEYGDERDPKNSRVPGEDSAAEQFRKNPQACLCRGGKE